MNILIWLVVGGVIGWLASWLMRCLPDDPRQAERITPFPCPREAQHGKVRKGTAIP